MRRRASATGPVRRATDRREGKGDILGRLAAVLPERVELRAAGDCQLRSPRCGAFVGEPRDALVHHVAFEHVLAGLRRSRNLERHVTLPFRLDLARQGRTPVVLDQHDVGRRQPMIAQSERSRLRLPPGHVTRVRDGRHREIVAPGMTREGMSLSMRTDAA